MKKVPVALVLVLLASFALAACGSSSSDTTGGETAAETTTESGGGAGGGEAEAGGGGSLKTLKIEAAASGLEFASDSAESEAGEVDLEFENPQSVPHNVAIENSKGEVIGETETIAEGGSATAVDLKPGKTYTYFCTIPGHREAGMEGTLTVK